MKIIEIIPKDNYVLYIKDENGVSGIFDEKALQSRFSRHKKPFG